MRLLMIALTVLFASPPFYAIALEPDPDIVIGYKAGATRQFEAPGIRLIGAMALYSSVFAYESDAFASNALPAIVAFTEEDIVANGGTLSPASPPDIGDEALAFAGDLTQDGTTFVTGLLAWREGRIVHLLYAAGISGDMFPELIAVAQSITGRVFIDGPVATPATSTDMHSGGPWDLLPTLNDVPEGFVFKSEDAMSPPA